MNKVIKAAWIKALRSGSYIQGQGTLRGYITDEEDDPCYCVLGVLCEVSGLVDQGILERLPTGYKSIETGREYFSYPPIEVLRWANIPVVVGEEHTYVIPEPMSQLSFFNDKQRSSFDELANWIEENL